MFVAARHLCTLQMAAIQVGPLLFVVFYTCPNLSCFTSHTHTRPRHFLFCSLSLSIAAILLAPFCFAVVVVVKCIWMFESLNIMAAPGYLRAFHTYLVKIVTQIGVV